MISGVHESRSTRAGVGAGGGAREGEAAQQGPALLAAGPERRLPLLPLLLGSNKGNYYCDLHAWQVHLYVLLSLKSLFWKQNYVFVL
jgi:hypothetical protein